MGLTRYEIDFLTVFLSLKEEVIYGRSNLFDDTRTHNR
jgi:hypothetical protein